MKDIIVTGMGVLSPIGCELESFWQSTCDGVLAYDKIAEILDNPNYRVKMGAKIKEECWMESIPEYFSEQYGRASCYAVFAAKKAIEDARIDLSQYDPNRIAVIVGTTMGEVEVEEKITKQICSHQEVRADEYRKYTTANITDAVCNYLGINAMQYNVPAACAAGNYAVSIGKKLLDWNLADAVIAGGVDVFSYVSFAGFQRLLSLASDRCRPFDKRRKGIVIGEGAGMIVMEREKSRKNQNEYGRILGVGLSSNAYHMTAPHKDGEGEYLAMKKALDEAELNPTDIGYISAHGTGTYLNDKMESQVITKLFGSYQVPVSSIKSMLGHSMGAASMFEMIASFMMLNKGILLPTVNYQMKDDEIELDIIANQCRKQKVSYILSNAFAFGGQTSCVALGV